VDMIDKEGYRLPVMLGDDHLTSRTAIPASDGEEREGISRRSRRACRRACQRRTSMPLVCFPGRWDALEDCLFRVRAAGATFQWLGSASAVFMGLKQCGRKLSDPC
jgi:hypothetical protein